MKTQSLVLVASGACIVALLTAGSPTVKPQSVTVAPMTEFERTGTTMDGWDWTKATWTEDDAPYQAIVDKIEYDLHHGKTAHAVVTNYHALEEYHSQDPLAVFAWGAAKWRSSCWVSSNVASDWDLSALPDELADVYPQPHTYNYVRLRFLVQADGNPMPELQSVGERLLAHDPKDVDVQWQLIKVLRRIQYPAQNAEAIKIAQALVDKKPTEMMYRQALTNCLIDRYNNIGHKAADAETAITGCKDYIAHADSTDPLVPVYAKYIPELKEDETETWPPYRPMPPRPMPPPRIMEDARPPLHRKDTPLPTGPGEPMPSVPRGDQ